MFQKRKSVKQNTDKVSNSNLIRIKLICSASLITLVLTLALPSSFAQTKTAEKEVAETTDIWLDTVTSGTSGVVNEVVSLYAENAVLWGTVSEQVRDTPEEISDYFEYFAKLTKLNVNSYRGCVRIYGENTAVNSGYYSFTYQKNGETKVVPARYSFTYQKNGYRKWEIIEHHSSVSPEAPELLSAVNTDNDACENGLLVKR